MQRSRRQVGTELRRPLTALLAVVVVAACGCGSARPSTHAQGSATASTKSTPSPPAPAHAPHASLTVTYFPHGQSEDGSRTWRLTCAPARGTHPRAAEACQELAAHASALGPVRRPCVLALTRRGAPASYVAGTEAGRPVARLARPACDRSLWSELHALLTGA